MAGKITLASIAGVALLAQAAPQPTNDLPNPYRTIEGWAKLPPGRTWGATSAVDIANDGVSIWVAERCGGNTCTGSTLDPILRFDEVPQIEVQVIDRPGEPSLGTGECAAGPTAAAIANALFDALGVRVRDLPLTPERIAAAM